jgi:uracil DNA glycosylase/ribonuclease HI
MDGICKEWLDVLAAPELDGILEQVRGVEGLCPEYIYIFEFARQCPWPPKCVICGQDPYADGTATGLAFSVPFGAKVPPSLRNIAAAIGFQPAHGDLTLLAQRGVALINSALTTVRGQAKAHSKLWRNYIRGLLSRIPAPILAFGDDAAKISGSPLTWGHPSPLNRANMTDNPLHFKYCPHFAKIPIDWNWCGPPAIIYTDGGAINNGKKNCRAAYAAIVDFDGARHTYSGEIFTQPTNNRGELTAILVAIRAAKKYASWGILYTDSEYAINCITKWYANWMKTGAKKENMDLIGDIIAENYPTEYHHVRSHQSAPTVIIRQSQIHPTNLQIHQGNMKCDALCTERLGQ